MIISSSFKNIYFKNSLQKQLTEPKLEVNAHALDATFLLIKFEDWRKSWLMPKKSQPVSGNKTASIFSIILSYPILFFEEVLLPT